MVETGQVLVQLHTCPCARRRQEIIPSGMDQTIEDFASYKREDRHHACGLMPVDGKTDECEDVSEGTI